MIWRRYGDEWPFAGPVPVAHPVVVHAPTVCLLESHSGLACGSGSLRRPEARSFDAIVVATGAAFATITPADARSFFVTAGYTVPSQPF